MSRSAADPESPRRSRVLIADDNEPNRELLEVYLTDIDCDIATAVDEDFPCLGRALGATARAGELRPPPASP